MSSHSFVPSNSVIIERVSYSPTCGCSQSHLSTKVSTLWNVNEHSSLSSRDGVQRGLIGTILARLEARGLKLVGLKMLAVPESLAQKHYAEHEGKPFYEGLIRYICAAPVVTAVFEGSNAVAAVRASVGATNPAASPAGTIRGDFALEIGRNLIHASDSPETGAARWPCGLKLASSHPGTAQRIRGSLNSFG